MKEDYSTNSYDEEIPAIYMNANECTRGSSRANTPARTIKSYVIGTAITIGSLTGLAFLVSQCIMK
jgi:hypothetical protein